MAPRKTYKCNNQFGKCSNAINNVTFQFKDGQDLICPKCGSRNIEPVPGAAPSNSKTLLPKIVGVLLAACVIAAGVYLFLSHKKQTAKPFLVLAGSNTIGEALGPQLVMAYLKSIGATDVSIHPKMLNDKEIADEKQIDAKLNGENIYVEIRAHGSKTGFRDLLNDSTNIGMASEPINDSIFKRFSEKMPNENLRSFTSENIIGHDGIAVIVNANNQLSELSIEKLKQMFGAGGLITDWNQLPESGKSGTINVYRRDDKSGTTGMFKSMVLKGGKFVSSAATIENSGDLVAKVSHDPNGIGFVSYTFTKDQNGIKVLALKATEDIQALVPIPITIKNENYPLSRRLFMYCLASDTNSHLKPFIQFVLKNDGQQIVDNSGFVDLTPSIDTTKRATGNLPPGYADLVRNAVKTSITFRFKSGSTTLDNLAEGDLKRLFNLYYQPENKGKKVILIGFADNVGSPERNLIISQERAEVLRNRLSQLYIPIQDVRGFGEALPVQNNNDEQSRSQNRRVEVWLTE